ncbi:hypothetical protein COV20_05230 [Candidatus Woesearchaeota archaeon CG10_big_fil_rev_8_21_14_0_10_45_16]|nr:MAG: hypothetical protein COV20_05230 [Candidatus Woesearchaeota archaeon CG10_big_fil_rev_8_21_14_0_10_45_16]
MAKTTLQWTFPRNFLMRIEITFLALTAVLVFIFSYFELNEQVLQTIIFTAFFVGLYALISYLVMMIRQAEEKYHLTSSHLEIHKKSRNKRKKHKVPLKSIIQHKVDHFFLGGYVITKDGEKHVLFFNTRKEVEAFDKFLRKYSKSKKR